MNHTLKNKGGYNTSNDHDHSEWIKVYRKVSRKTNKINSHSEERTTCEQDLGKFNPFQIRSDPQFPDEQKHHESSIAHSTTPITRPSYQTLGTEQIKKFHKG